MVQQQFSFSQILILVMNLSPGYDLAKANDTHLKIHALKGRGNSIESSIQIFFWTSCDLIKRYSFLSPSLFWITIAMIL